MKQNYSLILDDEFIQYCKLNDIEDIEKLAKETFNKGFLQLKYGWVPKINPDKVIITSPVIIKENKSKSEPQKEDITDTQIESDAVVQQTIKTIIRPPKTDLYDE